MAITRFLERRTKYIPHRINQSVAEATILENSRCNRFQVHEVQNEVEGTEWKLEVTCRS